MERSKSFYTDLGWKVESDFGISVFFERDGGSLIGLYGRDDRCRVATARGQWLRRDRSRPRGPQRGGVDEILAEAQKAGATILKPATSLEWGGYGGSFADPNGHIGDSATAPRERTSPTRSRVAQRF